MYSLQSKIDSLFANPPADPTDEHKKLLDEVLQLLESGNARVAEKKENTWITNQWLKQAILLYFKWTPNQLLDGGCAHYFDKVPLQFATDSAENISAKKIRIVPPAIIRRGSHIANNVILMPSFVNIGAHVGEGTMVDTWATVGSCAQIGKNVHLSGGVGIGGVLEPLQSNPTIIEDHCFIGARSEIVEGVIVEHGSVISMGVFIGQSTPIYNRATQEISYGRIPPYSVVIPGSLPSKDGDYHRYAAIIIKQVDEKTRSKTSLNQLLRD